MLAALRGSTLVVPDGMPLVWAREPARRDARRPRLRPRADAPLLPALRRARPPRLALRRPRPGLARPARAVAAPPPPRHPDRRRLLAPVPRRSTSDEEDAIVDQINEAQPGRALGRDRRAEAGEVDGAHARAARRAGDVRRGRRLRLPRRPRLDGAALDAGARARVDLPHRCRSRAGCCRATSTTTRASWRRSRASTWRERRRDGGSPSSAACERVAVVGLGRVGLPLALSFADRGLDVIGVEREPAVLDAGRRRAACRSAETGTQELLERVLDGADACSTTALVQDAADADHIVLTLGTPAYVAHRDRHVADPQRDRRPAAGAARGPLADPALDGRARHDRLGGRLHRAAPRLRASARTCSSRTCPSGSPRTTSSRRSPRCPASSAASARARAPGPPSCSRRSAPRSSRRRRCRPSWRRSGPTSCATRSSRCRTS